MPNTIASTFLILISRVRNCIGWFANERQVVEMVKAAISLSKRCDGRELFTSSIKCMRCSEN